jgi:hypothetical protein
VDLSLSLSLSLFSSDEEPQTPFFNEGLNLEDAINQRARQNSRQFVEKRFSRISNGELWIISASLFVCRLLFAVPH